MRSQLKLWFQIIVRATGGLFLTITLKKKKPKTPKPCSVKLHVKTLQLLWLYSCDCCVNVTLHLLYFSNLRGYNECLSNCACAYTYLPCYPRDLLGKSSLRW